MSVPGKIIRTVEDLRSRFLSRNYNLFGCRRIYHIHIRKTGGTSLNCMVHSLAKSADYSSIYDGLIRAARHRVLCDRLVFVAWNLKLINRGHYFFAFSHLPIHQLQLPPRTFTVTCFRDPAARLISHYNMLMEYRVNNVAHPCMQTEGPWLGGSFRDFLDRIPREHLQNQLFMFSPSFNIPEAISRVREVSHVMFTESFAEGVEQLNRKTGLGLKPIHTRKSGYKTQISAPDLDLLRQRLTPEYEFLEKVKGLVA